MSYHHATRLLALAMLAAGAVAVLTACGSPAASSSAALGSAIQQDCTAVSDVLSDGPDPDADPVGYAQAQVLPLRQLTISDVKLRSAVQALAAAYQEYSSGSGAGGGAAKTAVTTAESAVNAICPQAAP